MSFDPHDVGCCISCEHSTCDWTRCSECREIYCCGCAEYELTKVDEDTKLCKACLSEPTITRKKVCRRCYKFL